MSKCPCCGGPIVDPDVEVLRHMPASRLEAAVIGVLIDVYPNRLSRRQIADRIYAMDPNGGPLGAENVIGVRLHQLKPRLAALGWRTKGMMGPGSLGIRLEPLDGSLSA